MNDQKPDSGDEKPKIVVDEDWKAEVQAEKEKLAEKEARQSPAGPARAAPAPAGAQMPELPPASFTVLVSTLATQALLAMGAIKDPQTRQPHVDLQLAKHHVDLLGVLQEKTKGNLTEQEQKLIDNALYEIRMQYVHISQAGAR